jgi:signal transduction histidine kinase
VLGMYWKGASRRGALTGISAGFILWIYTLLLPSFARSGWLDGGFVEFGPWGLELLKPYALLGMDLFDPIGHALFWTLFVNVATFIVVSLFDRQSPIERIQGTLFVEVFDQGSGGGAAGLLHGAVAVGELQAMAERFLGRERTREMFGDYGARRGFEVAPGALADGELVQFVERRLAGAIGAASARVMVASTIKGEGVGIDEIMQILDETSQVLEYSRQLEQKSKALEKASAELKAANERLTELDRMKDDFLSTVTHELRTPLTSIRSFSEILHDSPDLDLIERQHFLTIIIRESERLTRLINQVLDLTKIETGRMKWQMTQLDVGEVIQHSVASLRGLFEEREISVDLELSPQVPPIRADRDQLIQLVINLLSNAQKFCPHGTGRVKVGLQAEDGIVTVSVADNGPGIPYHEQEKIFEKFHQVRAGRTGNPMGSGLGLAICRGIVEHLGGRIWVESDPGHGATFYFTVPLTSAQPAPTPGRA